MTTITMMRSLATAVELARELKAEQLGNEAIGPITVNVLLQRIIDECQAVRTAIAERGGMNP